MTNQQPPLLRHSLTTIINGSPSCVNILLEESKYELCINRYINQSNKQSNKQSNESNPSTNSPKSDIVFPPLNHKFTPHPPHKMWFDLPYLGSIGGNCVALAFILAFDVLFAPKQARWFAIHAFANAFVVLTSVTSAYTVVVDPVHAMDSRVYNDHSLFGNASPWPILVVNAVHVYHMLAFSKLTSSDYFHHLMFIPTVGFFGQYYEWGAIRNFLCLFISGLPGGVDYCMLVLVKHGYVKVITQKRVCASLNTWVRAPGITYEVGLMYIGFMTGNTTVPWPVILMISVLSWFNAQYYCKQSVANYAITHVFGHVEEKISKVTGTPVPTWGKEAKAPQNLMS